ncbi:hypothetical protein BV22DRAFT_1049976 [Leucogyrophana mollusca]|uniref:Uncharacterized protein n=1 Tax=Leucogyrophana mollusca TaxID=85980 RepID=A0ACB8B7V1_9AGAM|nr:hypothetical protein BV22DRAFT_1049976 [Leucogyrophana mollusca]
MTITSTPSSANGSTSAAKGHDDGADALLAQISSMSISAEMAERIISATRSRRDECTSPPPFSPAPAPPARAAASPRPPTPRTSPLTSAPAIPTRRRHRPRARAALTSPAPEDQVSTAAAPLSVPAAARTPAAVATAAPMVAQSPPHAPAAPPPQTHKVPAVRALSPPAAFGANYVRPAQVPLPYGHCTVSYKNFEYDIPAGAARSPFYLVTKGRRVGIFSQWQEASPYVIGVAGAVFSKTRSVEDGLVVMKTAIDGGEVEVLP